jgi:hypothetical protein
MVNARVDITLQINFFHKLNPLRFLMSVHGDYLAFSDTVAWTVVGKLSTCTLTYPNTYEVGLVNNW